MIRQSYLTEVVIKCSNINHIYCPQYQNLSIESILKELKGNPMFMKHMPDEKEIPKLPKQWIINLASTTVGEQFDQWIVQKIFDRNQKLAEDKNLLISVDPEVAAAIKASNVISCKTLNGLKSLFTGMVIFFPHTRGEWHRCWATQDRLEAAKNEAGDAR